MADFEANLPALAELGIAVYAASVDTGDDADALAKDVSFPLAQGVTREIAEQIGAWWEDRRGIVQPSQFLFRRGGEIVQSTYSDGPLGRLEATDVCGLVGFLKKQAS